MTREEFLNHVEIRVKAISPNPKPEQVLKEAIYILQEELEFLRTEIEKLRSGGVE